MSITPSGTRVPFVRPDGVAGIVRDAINRNLLGLRDLITALGGNVVEIPQNADGSWPTLAVRRPGIRYRWVANVNPARIPDATVGAVKGDEVSGFASMWIGADVPTPPKPTDPTDPPVDPKPPVVDPPPADRIPSLEETFTGVANGSAWPASRWTAGARPAGGGADVTNQAGRLTTGAVGSWSPADVVSVRAVPLLRDFEATYDFTTSTEWTMISFHCRSDSGVLDTVDGLALDATPTALVLAHAKAGTWTADVTVPKTHAKGATYRARVIVATQVGGKTLIRARTWPTAGAEPATWDIDTTTVPAPTTPGYFGFAVPGIGSGRGVVTIDSITVWDRPPTSGGGWGTWVE